MDDLAAETKKQRFNPPREVNRALSTTLRVNGTYGTRHPPGRRATGPAR